MTRNPRLRAARVDLAVSVLNGGMMAICLAAVGESSGVHPLPVAMATAAGLAVFVVAGVRYARARRGDRR
ncbi:hypothetical protein [Saccharopolyspora sp. NPDC049426]|uniref:hypothetical protein n=1 Tax=Saccharopolyspora sp. NPDC049426 TaxID=3155652 RepID=UPI0034204F2E